MNNSQPFTPLSHVPSPQEAYRRAAEVGFNALAGQSEEQAVWLGAEKTDAGWRVPALDNLIEVRLDDRRIVTSAGNLVGPGWSILVLHYLSLTERPEPMPAAITFADLPESRSYAGVYDARVIKHLCATAGQSTEELQRAAASADGRPAQDGDLAFDFSPFPRLAVRLIWYAPDDEFPPSATLLLPENIESWFCPEDIVVLSECLVARLAGQPF